MIAILRHSVTAVLMACLLASPSARAASGSATWSGATDVLWSTPGNWSGSLIPGAGNTATFNAASGNTGITVGTINLSNITFDTASAAAYTLGATPGTGTITFGDGTTTAVTMNSTVTANETINANLTLGTAIASTTSFINDAAGLLTLGGNITGGTGGSAAAKTLIFTGAGNTTVGGIIGNGGASSVALTKSGSGVLTLTGANTFTGGVTINGGTIDVASWNLRSTNGTWGNSATLIQMNGGRINYTGGSVSGALRGVNLVSGNNTIDIISGSTLNFAGYSNGFQSNGGNLIKEGGGTLQLGSAGIANNIFTGKIAINAGTLEWWGSGSMPVPGSVVSDFITINNGAIFALSFTGTTTLSANIGFNVTGNAGISSEGTHTIAGVIADGASAGGFTKSGNGTLTLSGANTYTGTTTVSSGTLAYGINNAIGTGNVTVSGGNLSMGTYTDSVGAVTVTSGNITGSGTLTSTSGFTINNTTNSTISTVLDGAVDLSKSGSGTLTLTAANTYSGTTTVNAGTLTYGVNNAIGTGNVTVAGGDLALGTHTDTVGTVTVTSGNITGSGTLTSTSGFTINNTANSTISTILGGAVDLSKSGSGTLTLTAANTYSGMTTISAGTLAYGINSAIGTGNVTVSGGDLAMGTYNDTVGTVTVTSGNITGSGTLTSTGGFALNNSGNSTISTALSGSVGLVNAGSGVMTLSGTNLFSGGVTINGGAISVASWNNISTNGVWGNSGSFIQMNGGRINYTGASLSGTLNGVNLVSGNNTIDVISGSTLNFSASNIFESNGGNLIKEGLGTLQLGSAGVLNNIFTGKVIINAGTLEWWGAGSMPVPGSVVSDFITINNGGTFALSFTGSTTLSANIGFNVTGNAGISTEGTHVISGVIADGASAGGFTKSGNGTLTLSGANSYTGTTTVSSGTLAYGINNAIASGNVTVSGGNLSMGSYTDTVGAVTVTSGNITGSGGTLTSTSGFTINNPANSTISAILGGAVDLSKSGNGTLTLTAANTYTGTTTVSAGTLAYGTGNAIGTGNVTVSGGDLAMGTYSDTVGAVTITSGNITGTGGTLTSTSGFTINNPANSTISVKLGGAVGLVKTGTGTLTLSGANTFSGGVTINGGAISVASWNNISTDGVWGNSASFIQMNGGQINYTGASLSAPLHKVNLASGNNTIDVISGSTLNFAYAGYANLFQSSGGNLIKEGLGTLQLGSPAVMNNIFTGKVIINAGTLDWWHPGSMPTPASLVSDFITINNGGTFAMSSPLSATLTANIGFNVSGSAAISSGGAFTIAGVIADGASSGGLTKSGTGTLTLSAANTYTGTTTVSSGTLALANILALQNSALDTSGAGNVTASVTTLTLGGLSGSKDLSSVITTGYGGLTGITLNPGIGFTSSYSGNITNGAGGGMTLTKSGAGTQILSGANTFTGVTTLSAGTLSVSTIGDGGAAGNLGQATNAASNLVFDGGTLQYTGASASTDRNFTINSGKTAVIEVTTNTLTLTGGADATNGDITKTGAGTLILTGNCNNSGAITVSGGALIVNGPLANATAVNVNAGTLQLGAAERINSLASLTMSGGTLDVAGYSQSLGVLALTSSTTSVLDFGTGASTLHFSSITPAAGILAITNWTEGSDSLQFTSNVNLIAASFTVNGLSAEIMNRGSYYEVIPEPATWALLAFGLISLVLFRKHRRENPTEN